MRPELLSDDEDDKPVTVASSRKNDLYKEHDGWWSVNLC